MQSFRWTIIQLPAMMAFHHSFTKDDLMALFSYFHKGELPLHSLNFGTIILVPKSKKLNKYNNIDLSVCWMLFFGSTDWVPGLFWSVRICIWRIIIACSAIWIMRRIFSIFSSTVLLLSATGTVSMSWCWILWILSSCYRVSRANFGFLSSWK